MIYWALAVPISYEIGRTGGDRFNAGAFWSTLVSAAVIYAAAAAIWWALAALSNNRDRG